MRTQALFGMIAVALRAATLIFQSLVKVVAQEFVGSPRPLIDDFSLARRDRLINDCAAARQRIRDKHVGCTRPIVDRLLIANRIGGLERRIETVSSDFSRAYLKQSDAIWIISYGVAALYIAARELVELPMDVSATLGPVGMTTRADDRPPAIVAELMKATRVVAAQLRHGTGQTLQ